MAACLPSRHFASLSIGYDDYFRKMPGFRLFHIIGYYSIIFAFAIYASHQRFLARPLASDHVSYARRSLSKRCYQRRDTAILPIISTGLRTGLYN
jgi:hypothetical protein